MQKFSFNVTMQVADSWVADGFQVKDRIDQIEDNIRGLLPYAYGHECVVKVEITGSPADETIAQLQNGEMEAQD